MAILLEPKLERIGECLMVCDCCGWEGTVYKCLPDVDGDGALGCPVYAANNNIGDDLHEKVQQFELTFRRLSNQDIQVLLNHQFLMQWEHQEYLTLEDEIAECMGKISNFMAVAKVCGKSASDAAKEFQATIKEAYGTIE